MWSSIYSTGVKEFDDDHAHIDAVIGHVARATDPEDEKKHLMDVYCSIISHVEFKSNFLGNNLSHKEQNDDATFLRDVRSKMREREEGLISRRQLIMDLRHMLMVHAMAHEVRERKSA